MSTEPQKHRFWDGLAEGLGCLLPLSLFALVIFLGCSGFFQWAKEESKKLEDKIETIEGVVEKVECYNVEPPVETEEKKKNHMTISIGTQYVRERTKVTFQDGRSKEFNGTIYKPLEKGTYYSLAYNGFNRIKWISEKKKEEK